MSGLAERLGLCRLVQWEHRSNLRHDCSRSNQVGNLSQDIGNVGRRLDAAGTHAVLTRRVFVRHAGYLDENAGRFEQLPGSIHDLTTNRVEHHIHAGYRCLDRGRGVIDDLFRPQRANELDVAGGCRARNVSAFPAPQLHGVGPGPARGPLNEQPLPCLEIGRVEETGPVMPPMAIVAAWSNVILSGFGARDVVGATA